MNTGADECIIEDLTSLVVRDMGADEPDMSSNDLSYVDIQDLFGSYQETHTGGQEQAVVETVAFVSPLDALKEVVLALDWEVSSSNLQKCLAEIQVLLARCQDDQFSTALLKMLSTIVQYLDAEKGNAHPDTVKVLTSVYVCLEKIFSALDMDVAEKNKLVAAEVVKFKTLRQKITGSSKGRPADPGAAQGPRDIDALIALKAMVLSIDWGEISQERIDAFFAEIAALKKRWQQDGTLVQGLEILRAYGQYIFVKKDQAHPDSFNQLFASYNSLERVLDSEHLTPADKKDIISLELQKFIALKKQIAEVKGKGQETSSPPSVPPVAEREVPAQKEVGGWGREESGQAASFLTAVDSRLDDFFAEKDATQAAALRVAELPRHERTAADDDGAPAAMSDDILFPVADRDEGPAMFMEEVGAPEQEEGIAAQQEEALLPTEALAPARMVDETVPLPAAPEIGGGAESLAELLPPPKKETRAKARGKKVDAPAKESKKTPARRKAEPPPPDVLPAAGEQSAPAAVVDEDVMLSVGDESPAMSMEEAVAPREELVVAVMDEEIKATPEEELVASVVDEETRVPEEEPLLMVMEEETKAAPEENAGVLVMQEEALLQSEESFSSPIFAEAMPLPPYAESGDAEELMAEVLPLAEEPDRAVSHGKTISVADEVGKSELSELLSEQEFNALDDQDLAFDRAAGEADAAEELFAAGIVSAPVEPSPSASSSPPWFDELGPMITGLQGECSDAAIAALHRQLAAVSARQGLPPADSIALDMLAAVSAQLAAMAPSDRAAGAALLESLSARLTTASTGVGAGGDASLLVVIHSLVHDFVVWQREAIRLTTGRYHADQATGKAAAATDKPPAAAAAPALAEETRLEPTPPAATLPRQDHTAPAPTFFGKIRQLFKK